MDEPEATKPKARKLRKHKYKEERITPVKVPSDKLMRCRNEDGNIVWLQKGLSLDQLPHKVWPFSQRMADIVCELMIEGMTIGDICALEGMPPKSTVYKWRTNHDSFRKQYDLSRKFRGETMADKAMTIANESKDYKIMEDRLKFEAHKWRAAVDDPDQYGPRTKITGDPNAPLSWVVTTGVPQPDGKPEEVTVESKKGDDGATGST